MRPTTSAAASTVRALITSVPETSLRELFIEFYTTSADEAARRISAPEMAPSKFFRPAPRPLSNGARLTRAGARASGGFPFGQFRTIQVYPKDLPPGRW